MLFSVTLFRGHAIKLPVPMFFFVLSFCLVPEKVAESKKNWAFTCLMDLHEQ